MLCSRLNPIRHIPSHPPSRLLSSRSRMTGFVITMDIAHTLLVSGTLLQFSTMMVFCPSSAATLRQVCTLALCRLFCKMSEAILMLKCPVPVLSECSFLVRQPRNPHRNLQDNHQPSPRRTPLKCIMPPSPLLTYHQCYQQGCQPHPPANRPSAVQVRIITSLQFSCCLVFNFNVFFIYFIYPQHRSLPRVKPYARLLKLCQTPSCYRRIMVKRMSRLIRLVPTCTISNGGKGQASNMDTILVIPRVTMTPLCHRMSRIGVLGTGTMWVAMQVIPSLR